MLLNLRRFDDGIVEICPRVSVLALTLWSFFRINFCRQVFILGVNKLVKYL